MGGVAAKCSDVTMDKSAGALKPLDASSSEESDDEDEEEDSEDEEDDEDGEDTKTDAEAALNDGLKRGRTATFKQLIHHSRDIGVDEAKIMKAEQMLKQHKEQRRRELFEAELRDFLDGEGAEDLEECLSYEKKGIEYGVKEILMDQLKKKVADLNLRKSLNNEEVAEAKLWLEVQTRSFVKAAVGGRSTVWVDMESGKKMRAVVVLDLIVRNFLVQKAGGDGSELGTCPVNEVVPKRALAIEDIANSDFFLELSGVDQENAVAWIRADGSIWLFVEESDRKLDELLAAITVLSGAGLPDPDAAKRKGKDSKNKKTMKLQGTPDGGAKELSPTTPRAAKAKAPESEEQESASGASPREKKDKKEKKDKGGDKDKKEKKDKKDKKDKKSKKNDD